jgi:hypothetical protein
MKIYRTAVLPVVLYECKTWSVTVMMIKDRAVIRMIELVAYAERGSCRKENCEKENCETLHNFYPSPNITTSYYVLGRS